MNNVMIGSTSSNKNVRTLKITIESEKFLNLIKTTPSLKNLFHKNQLDELKVGTNVIRVNNIVYSKLDRFGIFHVQKID